MANLPDEIWSRILELGVETCKLSYKDLCCLAISCRRFNRLSNDKGFWATLLTLDFPTFSVFFSKVQDSPSKVPPSPSKSPSKALYRTRFERDRTLRLAACRRAVLNVESQIAVCHKNLKDIERQLLEESQKMRSTIMELKNLERVRKASVALNVWQPEIVRGRQKQIVEQSAVPVESRIHALEMELKVCKQQIAKFTRASNDQKKKLDAGKEQLVSLKYHPLLTFELGNSSDGQNAKLKKQRKN